MRIEHVALLVAVASSAVSCATGTGDPSGVATLGNGGSPGTSSTPGAPSSAGGSSSTGTGGAPSATTTTSSSGPPANQGPAQSFNSTPPLLESTEVPGTYTMDLACSNVPFLHACVIAAQGDKDVPYILPQGTRRSSILYTITPSGPNANGTVEFAGSDPHDATVHVHGYAGPLSTLHIEVTGVMAIPE